MPDRLLRRACALAVSVLVLTHLLAAPSVEAQERYGLAEGETIGVMGNAFAEHLSLSGYFEALVQSAYPDAQISVRSVPWSGDEVGQRIREMNVPTTEQRLEQYGADVVVMFLGMSESFNGSAGLEVFERQLAAHLDDYLGRQFNGRAAPRLVLVSPIAHEDLGAPLPTGDVVEAHNADLRAYTDVMRRVAAQKGVRFVDLFEPSLALYAEQEAQLTSNGIHPNELGCFYFAKAIGEQLGWLTGDASGGGEAGEALRALCYDKFYHERHIYAATNTEYVWGRRAEPFGVVNFPPEMTQLEKMVAARQQAMWAMDKPTPAQLFANAPTGDAVWEATPTSQDFPVDTWMPPAVEQIDAGGSIGDINIADAEDMLPSFTVADGYTIEVFATEKDFAELASPLAMAFDDRGRLWVLCAPTYPHPLPGTQADCKILILEDTDADGRADTRTIFARHLVIPTGFAIDGDGAVYVGQAPYLYKLTDTDGDSVADRKETIYTGFGMPDSHHTISAFVWEPGGTILMHEGVFTRTNVETPYGTMRTRDAAVWRFDPRTLELTPISHTGHPNPWGHTIDAYGNGIMMDTSGPAHFNFAHLISPYVFPHKPSKPGSMLSRGRPNSGSDIIYSRHFPEDVQGTYVNSQVIGFHGTHWDRLLFDGATQSGYSSTPMPQDIVQSSDPNFRPVGSLVAPDGSLYLLDWCNPLIGHMQFSVRDPRRDNTHGRVWRIRHTERPLVEAPDVAGASNAQLLELLKTYEQGPRDRARRRLQRGDAGEVLPMLDAWLADLDEDGADYGRLMLEGLWIHQAQGSINVDLLEEVLDLDDASAVAGGVRVLRYWMQLGHIDDRDADRRIRRLTDHEDMRVRVELVMACAYLADADDAKDYIAEIVELPMDQGLQIAVQETLRYLDSRPAPAGTQQGNAGGPAGDSIARVLELKGMPIEELAGQDIGDATVAAAVLERDDAPFPYAGKR